MIRTDHPIGYWPLRDPAGSSAVDRTGGPTGIVEGEATVGLVPGPFVGTTAMHTNGGACDGIDIDASANRLHPASVTVEAWVRTDDAQPLGDVFRVRDGGFNLTAGAAGVDLTLYPATRTVTQRLRRLRRTVALHRRLVWTHGLPHLC
jgi:hypothetical protein